MLRTSLGFLVATLAERTVLGVTERSRLLSLLLSLLGDGDDGLPFTPNRCGFWGESNEVSEYKNFTLTLSSGYHAHDEDPCTGE